MRSKNRLDALESAVRIGVIVMATAVSACGGFIGGVADMATGEYDRREKALASRLDLLAERQAALDAEKLALTGEQRRLAGRIDQTRRELAAVQNRLSELRRADPATGSDIAEMERKVSEITQNIADLERAIRAITGQHPHG